MANGNPARAFHQCLDKIVVRLRFDEATRARHTRLSRCGEHPRDHTVHSTLDVDVTKHDVRRLATQFHLTRHEVVHLKTNTF